MRRAALAVVLILLAAAPAFAHMDRWLVRTDTNPFTKQRLSEMGIDAVGPATGISIGCFLHQHLAITLLISERHDIIREPVATTIEIVIGDGEVHTLPAQTQTLLSGGLGLHTIGTPETVAAVTAILGLMSKADRAAAIRTPIASGFTLTAAAGISRAAAIVLRDCSAVPARTSAAARPG